MRPQSLASTPTPQGRPEQHLGTSLGVERVEQRLPSTPTPQGRPEQHLPEGGFGRIIAQVLGEPDLVVRPQSLPDTPTPVDVNRGEQGLRSTPTPGGQRAQTLGGGVLSRLAQSLFGRSGGDRPEQILPSTPTPGRRPEQILRGADRIERPEQHLPNPPATDKRAQGLFERAARMLAQYLETAPIEPETGPQILQNTPLPVATATPLPLEGWAINPDGTTAQVNGVLRIADVVSGCVLDEDPTTAVEGDFWCASAPLPHCCYYDAGKWCWYLAESTPLPTFTPVLDTGPQVLASTPTPTP